MNQNEKDINNDVESDDTELETITEPFDPTMIDVKTRNPSIYSIMQRLQHQEIDLMPDFQRQAGLWDITKKSRFIESLLLRIPLPVFYVASDKDDYWIVIDGLQRLYTLNGFISVSDEKKEEKFALQGLEFLKDFENKKFAQLPRGMQRRILETEPVFHIIQPSTPKNVTRTIFQRINTGGLYLSAQEIRNALYQGQSSQLLKELANSKAFKNATNNSVSDERMMAREFVLRYLAFTLTPAEKYKIQSLDQFLSDAMEKLNQVSSAWLNQQKSSFKKAMETANQIFDKQAFRKQYDKAERTYPINKALFETWAVELSQCNNEQIAVLIKHREKVNEYFIKLLEGHYLPSNILPDDDIGFENAISQQTASVKKVHFRFKAIKGLIADILKEYLE
jgi:uncharacterized protein with ParB-like and HNH nuclease domain